MQWENEQKKRYLRQYIVLRRKEKEIEEEIETIRQKYLGRVIAYTGMPPAAGSGADLSEYAAEVDQLLTCLQERQREAVKAYRKIDRAIEQMADAREKEVLRLRYLQALEWKEVAERIGYELTNTYQIHGAALRHFPVIWKSP